MAKKSENTKKRRGAHRPKWVTDIALERIKILFTEAQKAAVRKKYNFANRYVEIARKISMRYNVRIPKDLKRRYCKYCYSYLIPGVNSTVRLNPKTKTVEVKCLNCGKVMRYPYKTNKKLGAAKNKQTKKNI